MRIDGLRRCFVGGGVALWALPGLAAGPCSNTPAAAVRAFESGASAADGSGADGYRVTRLQRDAVLGRSWAWVERCGHPELPGLSVATSAVAPGSEGTERIGPVAVALNEVRQAIVKVERAPLTVRAGETVRLWRREANVRLEMGAVTDEAGPIGARIKLHTLTQLDNGTGVRTVYGLVRGPADVEME